MILLFGVSEDYESLKTMNRKFLFACLSPFLTLFASNLSLASDNPPTSATQESYNKVLTGKDSNGALHYNHPQNFPADWRRGVVTGYHLGFRSLADEARELRRSGDIPETEGFFKSFYMDFHYANQEFNKYFFVDDEDNPNLGSIAGNEHPIELDVYGVTLGFRLGDNPNLMLGFRFPRLILMWRVWMTLDSSEELKSFLTTGSISILRGVCVLHTTLHTVIFPSLMSP